RVRWRFRGKRRGGRRSRRARLSNICACPERGRVAIEATAGGQSQLLAEGPVLARTASRNRGASASASRQQRPVAVAPHLHGRRWQAARSGGPATSIGRRAGI